MDFLAHNLSFLRGSVPHMVRLIEALPPSSHVQVVEAKSGAPTASVQTEDGRTVWLHSRYDPVTEAERVAEDLKYPSLQSFLVLGLGLGHVALAMKRRASPEARFYIFEPDLFVFREALRAHDLVPLFRGGRTVVFAGPFAEEVYTCLRNLIEEVLSGEVTIVPHGPSRSARPEWFDKALRGINDFVRSGVTIFRTSMLLPRKNTINRMHNLPGYVASPGIETYERRFQGFPAIVVSAGPSLAGNIHLLEKAKGKAVLIAVSTSLKALLARGIAPDFAALLDYHKISKRYFEGIDASLAVPLVCDPRASWESAEAYAGPKVFSNDETMNRIVESMGVSHGVSLGGATVAHLAFGFACWLGANPIIFVGQDLSFPWNITHVPGTAIYTQWHAEVNRFHTYEMKEWDHLLRYRPKLHKIEDVFGNPVYTDEGMFSYLKDFDLLCSSCGRTCIDATEGGARIKGTEVMTLAEALARHATREIPAERFRIETRTPEERRGKLAAGKGEVERLLEDCDGMEKVLARLLRALKRVRERQERGKDADRLVAQIVRQKEELSKYDRLYRLLSHVAKADDVVRSRLDRTIKAEGKQGVDKQKDQAARDEQYVTGILECCRYYRRALLEGKGAFEQAQESSSY